MSASSSLGRLERHVDFFGAYNHICVETKVKEGLALGDHFAFSASKELEVVDVRYTG